MSRHRSGLQHGRPGWLRESGRDPIWELGRDGVRDLILTLRRYRIDCDLVERDAIYYATNAPAVFRFGRLG